MPIVLDYAVEQRPIAVSIIIDRCGYLLNDEDHVRWTTLELLSWINEAVGSIINLRPAAGSVIAVIPLMAGTHQTITDSAVQLIDVVRNIAADGVTPGRAITRTERTLLDHVDPDWHSGPKKSTIYHYTHDDRLPHVFWCYPPAIAGTNVQVSYAALPTEVDSVDDSIGLNMEYAEAIVNYVCFRAMSKDSEFSQGAIAASYYSAFQASIGIEIAGAQSSSPNAAKP